MEINTVLLKFKSLQISKDVLRSTLGEDLYNSFLDDPCVVENKDVVFLLECFKKGNITLDQLLDWVNVVWFKDLFVYKEDHEECIASIMSFLEEADEEGCELTTEAIDKYIGCLSNNKSLE